MDESLEDSPMGGIDAEIKELLGLFDVPAFARRGQDLEYSMARLRLRVRFRRQELLEMVRLRLRQWAAAATGPETELAYFEAPIAPLWPMVGAGAPGWATRTASRRGLRTIARDLVASLERFNRRWADYFEGIDLTSINRQVDHYNRYYLIEKECSLGSSRLAARFFVARQHLTLDELRDELPAMPVPILRR